MRGEEECSTCAWATPGLNGQTCDYWYELHGILRRELEAEGCNYMESTPPVSAEGTVWSASKMFGSEPVPVITEGACSGDEL